MSETKLSLREAQAEARRCLYCLDAPCRQGCPASVDVAQFIRHLRFEDTKSAKKVIKDANPLGGICGTLCPSEDLCQKSCTLNQCGSPIHIRDLQQYVCDAEDYSPELSPVNGKKVAVVGAGPAGLSCASKLARMGYEVDVIEKEDQAAGVVAKEIPASRIDPAVIEKDLKELPTERIHFQYGKEVSAADIETFSKEYAAVFIGAGLDQDRISGVQIEDGATVMGCSQFLSDLKEGKTTSLSGTICVVGGGDSAIDAVCSSLEFGADKAILAYRRSREEMPSCEEEFLRAADQGVELMYQVSPVKVAKKEDGIEITFVRNRLVERPGEDRKGFEPIPGSEFILKASLLVFAIGKTSGEELVDGELDPDGIRFTGRNCFIGGDLRNGGATVVKAVSEGEKAALAIDQFLNA